MKHGVAFRKFSRTSSHRNLMLRNLVTSLFEHERIKTTLPKARDTARLAEKIITMGKKGDLTAFRKASAFILKREVVPKLFNAFAERYATREGGYTRIHKFGNRPGDNAPHAVLELVDGPQDLRLEMTARAVGWELVKNSLAKPKVTPLSLLNKGLDRETNKLIDKERVMPLEAKGELRPKTRMNLQKVLRFRDPSVVAEIKAKAKSYINEVLVRPIVDKPMRTLDQHRSKEDNDKSQPFTDRVDIPRAGQAFAGDTRSPLKLAWGGLGRKPKTKPFLHDSKAIFTRRPKPVKQ